MSASSLYPLKRHLVPIEAHFEFVLVLTYALPALMLESLLPPGLVLDTEGDYGFVAVACVQTRKMRPKGWPDAISQDFFLTGYRVFTRYKTLEGRVLRGLRILRSDTDRAMMVFGGNLFTHYAYHIADVSVLRRAADLSVAVRSDDGSADLVLKAQIPPKSKLAQGSTAAVSPQLPLGSVFSNIRDALKFAGPLPFTFDYEVETDSIIRGEGVRQGWHPQLVDVKVEKLSFLEQAPYNATKPILCSAFYIEEIPYYWKAGVREKLQHGALP